MAAESTLVLAESTRSQLLQRSRGVMAAERIWWDGRAPTIVGLQRSRGVMAAERAAPSVSNASGSELQRSRGVMAAERCLSWR